MSLEPGARYLVELQDCCIAGEFTATITAMVDADDDSFPPFLERIEFDNGVVLTDWGQCKFTEVDPG